MLATQPIRQHFLQRKQHGRGDALGAKRVEGERGEVTCEETLEEGGVGEGRGGCGYGRGARGGGGARQRGNKKKRGGDRMVGPRRQGVVTQKGERGAGEEIEGEIRGGAEVGEWKGKGGTKGEGEKGVRASVFKKRMRKGGSNEYDDDDKSSSGKWVHRTHQGPKSRGTITPSNSKRAHQGASYTPRKKGIGQRKEKGLQGSGT